MKRATHVTNRRTPPATTIQTRMRRYFMTVKNTERGVRSAESIWSGELQIQQR